MGKRAGEFVTLDDVIEEVGRDATRYFYLMRRHDTPLEFDLEVAKRQSMDNPVYYVAVRPRALRGDPAARGRAGGAAASRSTRRWRRSWRCPRRSRSCAGWATSPTSSRTRRRRASRTA